MKGWNQTNLGNVVEKIVGGGTPSKKIDSYWNGKIPWASVKDLSDGEFHLSKTKDWITKEGLVNSSSNLVKKGTVILPTRMGLGRVVRAEIDVAINQDLKALYPNSNLIDTDYFLWLLVQLGEKIKSLGIGATVSGVRLTELKSIQLLLPDIKDQIRISSVVSAYDDLIQNNQKRIKILEESAQRLYAEWFVNFKFPRHGKVKMIDSGTEFGMIPEGWRLEKIKQVARVNDSSIKKQNAPEIINYISIADVSTGKIDNQEVLKFSKAPSRARRIINHGDIIWSTVRPNRKSYALLLYPDQNTVVSTGFAVLTSKDVSFSYLYHWTTAQKFVDYLVNNAKGSAYPAVSGSDFEKAEILIPSKDVQRMFADIVDKYYEDKNILEKLNVDLSKSRDLLIENLVTGKKLLKK